MKLQRLWTDVLIACLALLICLHATPLRAAEEMTPLDKNMAKIAKDCAKEILEQFDLLLSSGQLNVAQLFDTFYVPIPDTDPQKFHTAYDNLATGIIRPILDKYLEKDPRLIYVIAVDKNGYLPTHNTRFSQPLTGDPDHDYKWNQSKRMYTNRMGLKASRNTDPELMQVKAFKGKRIITDMSVPIVVKNRHWGAIRIGYRDR
ncbi:MAG: chemotaxis protein [Deltaproteobacteria bacterium]|nr:chemotaxis protein [Deltaproteobacteria bacterium]